MPAAAARQHIAAALIHARRTGEQVSAGASASITDDDAYAVQDTVAQALGWFPDGMPRYWKSGGASRTGALTHAGLPAHGVRTAGASLADLTFHTPAIEAEIALRLGQAVTPEHALRLTDADAAALVDRMTVAIEIADSRWQGEAPAAWRLADQGSHGALLLGEWRPCERCDWARQRCEVWFGDTPVISHTGTYALGDPLWLLSTWLRHATRGGRTVPAHTVVTTGSWVGALPMPRGTDVRVRFAGLGEVGLRGGTVYAAWEEAGR